jgi:NTP pyrophosphatase (non-canonical NTP hydrolase)
MSGHETAREIVAKHGVDRYPTDALAVIKLAEELGELAAAFLDDDAAAIRKEYGDVGIALHLLGDKLGLDLETEMRAVVDGETRRFA